MRHLSIVLGALILALGSLAYADAKPYAIKTDAAQVKAGEKGKVSIQIVTSGESHVSADAPLKIVLESPGLKLEKAKLGSADAVSGQGKSPRFDVGFTADKKGAQEVDAQLTFIVCTKELCSRETEKVTVPVSVQ